MISSLHVAPSVDSLLDPKSLQKVLGLAELVSVDALNTLGYSGSEFFRVTVDGAAPERERFLAKRTVLSEDLGWYIAVNASRLSHGKEHVLSQYRSFLETHLGSRLDDGR